MVSLLRTPFRFGRIWLTLGLIFLGGCSAGGTAMVASLRQMVMPNAGADEFPLDPKFRYIRTTQGRHVGFAWLGHTERTPEGPVEVYYSASGEVLRLGGGRIVGAAGFRTEWRRVSVPRPSWASVAAAAMPVVVTRVRDVMPGYRFGVHDELALRAIAAPSGTRLRCIRPDKLTWFEEETASSAGAKVRRAVIGLDSADTWLPPARYAVDMSDGKEQVVYAEQCLSADLCLSWQRWSADMQATSSKLSSSGGLR